MRTVKSEAAGASDLSEPSPVRVSGPAREVQARAKVTAPSRAGEPPSFTSVTPGKRSCSSRAPAPPPRRERPEGPAGSRRAASLRPLPYDLQEQCSEAQRMFRKEKTEQCVAQHLYLSPPHLHLLAWSVRSIYLWKTADVC